MKKGVLKIETGVPIPPHGREGSGHVQVALRALKLGQSVVLPVKSPGNAYTAAGKYIGKGKFTVRQVDGGFRVWRIK